MTKTLVTGATGFVGAAVARKLLARGEAVRLLTRANSDRSNLDGLDAEIVTGDLTDPSTLPAAVQGCTTVYHVAADYRLWVRDPSVLYRANVDGSVALIRAAADAGVSRIVYTSSVAALGIPKDRTPGDEDTPVTVDDMVGHYKRSKFLAEEAVRHLADEGAPVVIVSPSTPVGPRDVKPTPTGRVILDAARGKIPAFVDTGLNVVHVDDVAEGHLLAAEKGEIGRRYVLGGENLSLREILTEIARLTGRRPPKVRLPRGPLFPVAWGAEAWARMTNGGEPMVTVDALRMARKWMWFSSDRAERELGYAHRPATEALADAIAWFREGRRL
ncbi:MAG: NAD-dependent epimerase/dehydratase family protein [Bauldia litoralis]